MIIITRAFALAVLAPVFVLLTSSSAVAQSLAMAPAEVIATFTPGQPLKVEFSVSNSSNQPVAVRTSVTDLWYDDQNQKTFGPAGSSPHSGATWIEFVPRIVTIDAQSSAKLTAFITPPADARGGHYAVAFVESKPELVQAAGANAQPVYANIRLGALILLTAAGSERYDVTLGDIALNPPTASENLKVALRIANHSNTHIFPKTTLTVFDHDQRVAAKAESPERRLLPGQTDAFEVSSSGDLAPGDYEGVLTVIYGGREVQTRSLPFTVRR